MSNIYVPTRADKKKYKNYAVVVLTPCRDYECSIRFSKCVANMIAYSWMHGLKVYAMGHTEREVVHWARNGLARLFKGSICEYTGQKYTHALWLDDDHVFNPDLAVKLAANGDKDVVSGLYFNRGENNTYPVAYVKDDNEDRYSHYPLVEIPPALVEIDAIGFGACLTRREVFDKMEDPYFAFLPGCGEDIYFCVHAKEAGAKIWLDATYHLGHITSPGIITERTFKEFLERNKDTLKDKIKVNLGGT